MAVKVRGKNIEVTQALKDYVEKRVQTITKQFKTVGEITAVMRVEKGKHTVEITVPASGIVLRAQETSENMYASIDQCVEKIERQIHKYKTRLEKRLRSGSLDDIPLETSFELEPQEEEPEIEIVRSKRFAIKPMTVDEAILQMDLLGHSFYAFKNEDGGAFAVVYKRNDGGYGLIEDEE